MKKENFSLAGLCDMHSSHIKCLPPIFTSYGLRPRFTGEIVTLKLYEDNALLKKKILEDGNGKVLVIDGCGSPHCALIGDQVVVQAIKNGWEGFVINGYIRDSKQINILPIGIKALGTCPIKSSKKSFGYDNMTINIGGTDIHPGDYVYADEDGVLISHQWFLDD
ncbi:MAG: ribonuclease E activity regulator RraA [Reichenbachiella sp.]|uniref:ribonuclease E activity regulator RraA n=1 Tax=Reichenbachiella sp. TaxID=2184521 RepID=UPI003263FDD3